MVIRVEHDHAPGIPVLRIEVDLDLVTHGRVAASLLSLTGAAGFECAALDVSDQFVSAGGLRVLARAVAAAEAVGRSWCVVGLGRAAGDCLQRWFPEVPQHTSVPDAVRSLDGARTGTARMAPECAPGEEQHVDDQHRRTVAEADVTGQLATVIGAAGRVLGVDDIGVMLLDEQGELRVLGAAGRTGAVLERAQRRSGVGPGPDTVRRRRPVVVQDLAETPEYAPVWEALRTHDAVDAPAPRAVLAVPVVLDGDVVGNLNAVRVQPSSWTSEDVRAVEAYADAVAGILRQGAAGVRREASGPPSAEAS
jgi:GAF domain-containing protein